MISCPAANAPIVNEMKGERGGFDVPKVGHGMVPGKGKKDNGALFGRSDANKIKSSATYVHTDIRGESTRVIFACRTCDAKDSRVA